MQYSKAFSTARQPLPQRREDAPDITDLVCADLVERNAVGIEKYGTPLQPNNGRDALLDAYQEALDLVKYLRQALYERHNR